MGAGTIDDEKHETLESSASSDSASPIDAALEQTPVTPVTLPPPIQDGGSRAWLQVVGSFLVFTNLWGFVFAYGTFQSYYSLEYLPSESPSDISWIGTVSTCLLIFCGVLSGPLFDLGYFRTMLLIGGLTETLAIFLLSLCTKYWQIMLTQGIMVGLANGLLYLPGLALVGRSFKKHRSIAMALTTCGAPTGGIIYTLMFQQLIGRLGFAWTIRVMGFFMFGTYLVSFPLLLFRVHNLGDLATGSARRLFDPSAFRDLPFVSYTFSNFSLFMGYMVPFLYVSVYGQTQLGMTQDKSLILIMVSQAASILGRLMAGYTAARIGVMVPWITTGVCSGVLTVAWMGVTNEAGLFVYATLYGFFSGSLIPLPPSVFPVVCPDPRVLGARLGMAQAIGSFASLIGAPIAGALLDTGGGNNYMALQLFSGLIMILGGCQLVGLYFLLQKRRDVGKLI